jgi:DNA helicase HerA-like ATPase
MGQVGDFVVVDARPGALFGRVSSVGLPESARLSMEAGAPAASPAPVAEVQLLAEIDIANGTVTAGLSHYPSLGGSVYGAHPDLVRLIAESALSKSGGDPDLALHLATIPAAGGTSLHVPPEKLFGRHCAVIGSTGGGKSWTIARMIEESIQHHAKLVVLDATGEFDTLQDKHVRHVRLGPDHREPNAEEVCFPFGELTQGDTLALFRPSGPSQAPRLRSAIKSLKLARLAGPDLGSLLQGGLVRKAGRPRMVFEDAEMTYARDLESNKATFDVSLLARQVEEECVWPSGTLVGSEGCWGNRNEAEHGDCISLVTRIEEIVSSGDLSCLFEIDGKKHLPAVIEEFLKSDSQRVLRISLRPVPFAHDAREVATNAIGRYLLDRGRNGAFRECPVVVILDEAHQFLNQYLGDESSKVHLDAFDLIAKEGRKFGLNICLATQRPRDIPEGVLSQIGTLIVHRITNSRDREIVDRACGDIDRSATSFLPTLSPGQAVIVGVDLPIPLTVELRPPTYAPDSRGPDYQAHWRQPVAAFDPTR